jgi:hypothetical protein
MALPLVSGQGLAPGQTRTLETNARHFPCGSIVLPEAGLAASTERHVHRFKWRRHFYCRALRVRRSPQVPAVTSIWAWP